MDKKTRKEQFSELFPDEPKFRLNQIDQALFDFNYSGYENATTLSKAIREKLGEYIPWISVKPFFIIQSKKKDTYKCILETQDNKRFETVLMQNKKGQWTICVSSQIGCAMRCTFCATGTMGLTRSLTADEIVDQYRFWKMFLKEKPELEQRISNVVFMGMGEPLANYENVKEAINTWLKYTDMGPTKITVSTVGILPQLKKILNDETWPNVRIAISLHSANQKKREEIMPSTIPNFLEELKDWANEYDQKLGNRKHHITFEYTLISGVTDTPELAHELGQYVSKTPFTKINLIPYNSVAGKKWEKSERQRIINFQKILNSYNVESVQRKTMGDDIGAACGQLVVEKSSI